LLGIMENECSTSTGGEASISMHKVARNTEYNQQEKVISQVPKWNFIAHYLASHPIFPLIIL